jgi:hypothetical protein
MKKLTRNKTLANGNTQTINASHSPPTLEEIRQRAHEIFLARGDKPGTDLEDWLRAELELKRERVNTNTRINQ